MNRVFFICPKCKDRVYEYVDIESDGQNTWKFKLECSCGNTFFNNYRIGNNSQEELAKKILNPKVLAQLAKATMKEMDK